MKKLFGGRVFDLLAFDGGFIIAHQLDEVEGKIVVGYKSVAFDTCMVEKRTANDYKLIKFGTGYENVIPNVNNFVSCNSLILDDGSVFFANKNGTAQIIDEFGITNWQGIIKYKDCGPSSLARIGHSIWASFAEKNALIRFNLKTMREELRIGGSSGDSSFNMPTGLWINQPNNTMLVCNSAEQNILEVNLKTYTVKEYKHFEEPVKKYINIDSHELVILESGLYKL